MTEHKEARHSARMPQTLIHKQLALLPEIARYSPLARNACDIANVLLSTGMLVAQLALLCWRDVNFDEYMIRVPGNEVRWVMMWPYVREVLLVWRGPVFSPDAPVLGPNATEVLAAAEQQLQRAFALFDLPGVNFAVIQSTSEKYGFARRAKPEPAAYVM